MKRTSQERITIIGSGIAGCFLAILLARKGYQVDLYERFSKKEVCDANSKRSYNITLYGYGIEIMEKAGLWKKIKPHLLLLRGTSTQITKNSKPIFIAVEQKDIQYYAVSRGRLIEILLDEASKNPLIAMHFETNLLSIDRYGKSIVVENSKTKKITRVASNVVFGADGVSSLVRMYVQQGQESAHTQEYATWSYKQVIFTPAMMKTLGLQSKVVYSWTRQHAFIISIPNLDGSLSALLVLPKGKRGYEALTTPKAVEKLVSENFPTLLPALSVFTDAILSKPEGNFVTIHTQPWYYKDFLAVIGDAAHGFYPFLGQGTSAAFGDCLTLMKLITEYGTNWEKIFPLYQTARKKNMDALGEVSKEGFLRYQRYKRADYEAIYVTIERVLYHLFPKIVYPPLYLPVITDPEHTATHVQNHLKQRRIGRYFGLPLIVAGLTVMAAVYEKLESVKVNRQSRHA